MFDKDWPDRPLEHDKNYDIQLYWPAVRPMWEDINYLGKSQFEQKTIGKRTATLPREKILCKPDEM